jgi:hypothetical protein
MNSNRIVRGIGLLLPELLLYHRRAGFGSHLRCKLLILADGVVNLLAVLVVVARAAWTSERVMVG